MLAASGSPILNPTIVWVVGTVIAAAIIGAFVWVIRRPFRWVWRHLVSIPLAFWFDGLVHNAVNAELMPIVAEQKQIRVDLKEHMADEDSRMDDLKSWVEDQHGELRKQNDSIRRAVGEIKKRLPK